MLAVGIGTFAFAAGCQKVIEPNLSLLLYKSITVTRTVINTTKVNQNIFHFQNFLKKLNLATFILAIQRLLKPQLYMKRIQLFEIEDFSWFPSSIRTSMTNLIIVFLKMMKTSEVICLQIKRIQKMYPFKRIVDMGSGSGGVMPLVHKELSKESDTELLLTDLHPNRRLAIKINRARTKNLHYQSTPLDATDLSETPDGLKTMINSFHHMPPNKAKEILKSAQKNRQPLFIYELAENKIPVLIWALFLPIALPLMMVMTWFMTPFVRPMTWQQLVFTYIIPIIPLAYAWDGQASYPRTYTFSDLEEMISEIQNDQYDWEVAPALNTKGKKSGYYILGLPK